MLIEVKVQSLGLDRSTSDPVVILKEADGPRVLPIWIGPGEASAIAIRLAGMEFPRPLTHDLLSNILAGLGGELRRVLITRMDNDTYFAELIIHRNGEVFSVDARPSDSIAFALRLQEETDQLTSHVTRAFQLALGRPEPGGDLPPYPDEADAPDGPILDALGGEAPRASPQPGRA